MHRMLAGVGLFVVLGQASSVAQTIAPQGESRDARWRDDVRFVAQELPTRHKNAFAYVSRDAFAREAVRLDSAVPRLNDAQMQLGLARLVAMLRDGHTRVPLPTYERRLPITIVWLDRGPYIVNADDEHGELIGALITSVNGRPIREVADTLRLYFSFENELGFRISPGNLLLRPRALRDVGLGGDSLATRLTVTSHERTWDVTVAAVPSDRFALVQRGPLPLYRQRPRERYWWTYMAAERTVFLQYNQCEDAGAFRLLVDSVTRAIDDEKPLRVVVDLRNNSGGNSQVVRPLIEALRSRPQLNRPDALYAIIGRATFSSGLFAANDFRTQTRATLIGEPSGERANHYGEVRSVKLPYSGLELTYSTNFHRLVDGDGESFAPDVLVPPTAEAYIVGRDPAMEWIVAHSRQGRP
jgi:hypothetical protein